MNYATSLEEVLCGVSLVAITMAIHGCGTLATLFACHAVKQHGPEGAVSFLRGGAILILAMPSASTSYYFALMQYTTVGSVWNLPLRWRLLDGMLPIAGLMTFAWSTGVLFALAQDFQTAQLSVVHARRDARRRARASAHADPSRMRRSDNP